MKYGRIRKKIQVAETPGFFVGFLERFFPCSLSDNLARNEKTSADHNPYHHRDCLRGVRDASQQIPEGLLRDYNARDAIVTLGL